MGIELEERNGAEAEKNEIDIRQLVNKVLSLWPWALGCVVLTLIISEIYLHYTAPKFQINASLLIRDKDNNQSNSELAPLQDLGLISGGANIDNEQGILTSLPIVEEVVRELQLNVSFYNQSPFAPRELWGNLLPFTYSFTQINPTDTPSIGLYRNTGDFEITFEKDGAGIAIRDIDSGGNFKGEWGRPISLPTGILVLNKNPFFHGSPNRDYTMKIQLVENVAKALKLKIDLTNPGGSGKQTSIINLGFRSTIPEKGVAILNKLIEVYLKANVADRNLIADSTMAFIDNRLVVVTGQLSDIEKDMQRFKQKNNITDIATQAQSLVTTDQNFKSQMANLEVQLSVINSLQGYMRPSRGRERIVPSSIIVQDPNLSALVSQYNGLLLERSKMGLTTTENNPLMQNMNQQISQVQQDMRNALQSVKNTTQAALNTMEGQQGLTNGAIKKVPLAERIFLDFDRRQGVLQQLYLFLLQKREETAISQSSTIANGRTLENANFDPKPVEPKSKIILLAAFILGIGIPFGFTYLRDLLNTRVNTKAEIESEVNLPIIGEISRNEDGADLVLKEGSRSIVSEQFRSLRANLSLSLPDADQKAIIVTSSNAGEGKSFISSNLALALSIGGKKVVLMEMDLRKPKIAQRFGIKYPKGFSSYVIHQAEIQDIIYPYENQKDLFLIPAGTAAPNPAELILHSRTKELFEYLRKEFDYIVIDTPPVIVSDSQMLGALADLTLYVVRLGVTHKDQLSIAKEMSDVRNMPRVNIVANDIQQKRYGSRYYGYGKGYGYGYGYGYGDYVSEGKAKSKRRWWLWK